MKVIFLPDYTVSNPYQKELSNSLKEQGVEVSLCKSIGIFSVLYHTIIRWKPDVFHLHWNHSFIIGKTRLSSYVLFFLLFVQILILKIFKVRIIWTAHNLLRHERRFEDLEIYFHRQLLRIYDGVIVHSNSAQKSLFETYSISPKQFSQKIYIIPHGNYIKSYDNTISQAKARMELGMEESKTVFLCFGAIRPYKGVVKLIQAFKSLSYQNINLLVAGKPLTEDFKFYLEEISKTDHRISLFLEYIPNYDVQIYMNSADVVVFPFTDIFTSGSLVLAMSFGKAIIAPNLNVIAENLDKRGVIFYGTGTDLDLTQALQKAALTCTQKLKQMGNYNLSQAEKFDWRSIAQKTILAYSKKNLDN